MIPSNWTSGNATKGYLPVDLNSPEYRLTSREGHLRGATPDSACDWRFGRVVDGRHVVDPTS